MTNHPIIPGVHRFALKVISAAALWAMLTGGWALASAQGSLQLRPRLPAPQSTVREDLQVFLVRNVIMAVNQANRTEDYNVLRSLGTPEFQRTNAADNLALAFRPYRDQNIDLSQVIGIEPIFLEPSGATGDGALRLVGVFPTNPLEVNFDLSFERINSVWLVTSVSVSALPPQSRAVVTRPFTPYVGSARRMAPVRGIPAATTDY